MTRVTVNGNSLNVKSYEKTFLISNKEVADGFGVREEAIRYQKTQGSTEYQEGIHFTTVSFRDWASDFILEAEPLQQKQVDRLRIMFESVMDIQHTLGRQDQKLTQIHGSLPLSNAQQHELKMLKNNKVEEISCDKELSKIAHRKIWVLFKQHFSIPRYSELPMIRFQEGCAFINALREWDIFPNYLTKKPLEEFGLNDIDEDFIPF